MEKWYRHRNRFGCNYSYAFLWQRKPSNSNRWPIRLWSTPLHRLTSNLFPPKHHITDLIIRRDHLVVRQSSAERTLVELRKRYWIPRGRVSVKSVVNKCFEHKKRWSVPVVPLMSPLLIHRLQDDRPAFSNVVIDYFRPILTVVGRRHEKRRGIIFTSLVVRAVHFEIAFFLDTSSFLMAFWRFSRRRILLNVIYSDNGTNLTAREKE